jgi:hypothetical protein
MRRVWRMLHFDLSIVPRREPGTTTAGSLMKGERQTEYLRRAKEAERRAREVTDASARDMWREIARGYWLMAGAKAPASQDEKAA